MRRKGNSYWNKRDQDLLVRFWPDVKTLQRRMSAQRTEWAIYQKARSLGLLNKNFTSDGVST